MERAWHALPAADVVTGLETNAERGLEPAEAERRLARYGANVLAVGGGVAWWRLLLGQFSDFMVLVLLAATGLSAFLGETGDAITILAILVMNAVLGFLQEYRAEQAVEALKRLTAPTARVLRGGRTVAIPAAQVVPGDVLCLEAGDRVAADARILEAWSLATDDSTLTGESHPVAKGPQLVADPDVPVAERRSLVFAGTAVTRGRGRAVAVGTGMDTEVGRIAHLMEAAVDDETPLNRRLRHLGQILVGLSLAIVAVVAGVGIWRGEPVYRMFLTGVSLAVAAIPEGLPAIVTVALALGVQRMIRRHAIVRRLPAVETLGAVTVIASDKTGTLTQNRMTVVEVRTASGRMAVGSDDRWGTGAGGAGAGELPWCARAFVLASTERPDDGGVLADPTEEALVRAAALIDADAVRDLHGWRRWGELPFEPERRRMTVAVDDGAGHRLVFMKGAADVVVARCRWVLAEGRTVPLDPARRRRILEDQEEMAGSALRVLAFAYRVLDSGTPLDAAEADLVFLGLAGLMDPARPEAVGAVAACRRAGVRTVMITGDHPLTAAAIAETLGIVPRSRRDGDRDWVLTGTDLDRLDDDALAAAVDRVRVFARVAPVHKLRVVRALKRRGHVVAMTGDGVNDAPAVKEADIGVAMGLTGTEVTKEASDIILTDDNFATIVAAVQEGRAIYDNIRKFIRYLLSCNVGEVLVMLLAVLIGLPLPLLPIQILFVNLATDGLPALALGLDPPAPGVMRRPPRPPGESVFARGLGAKIAIRGILIGTTTLGVFWLGLRVLGMGLPGAETLALATLVMSQLFHVFDARAEDRNFLEVGLWSNPWVVGAVLSSIAMLLAVIYVPPVARLFRTQPLTGGDWILVVTASGFVQLASAVRYLVAPAGRWALER